MNKKLSTFLLLCLALSLHSFGQNKRYSISGFIRESGSRELLPGATVYFPQSKQGTVTNNYGFYSITLPEQDSLKVSVSYVGYQSRVYIISLHQDVELNIDMESSIQLKEVKVTADRSQQVSKTTQMSVVEVPVQQIKDIPALLGEKDVLKVLQLMPGVQKGSEGNAGLYVRGGGDDQNLIILDDAVVYNAFHLFGFFSLFNGDALKSVELTKGGFPARYGGRLSSVIDMTMKDGSKEKFKSEAGLGLLSSRATVEGPIIKNKSSFLFSIRRTYIDIISQPLILAASDGETRAGYFFYDMNAKLNYELGKKDRLYLSGYFGKDKFYAVDNSQDYKEKVSVAWGNATGTLRWNHLFNSRLFSNTSLIFSNYRFKIGAEAKEDGAKYKLDYFTGIRDYTLKYDLDYRPGSSHIIRMGVNSTLHTFTPKAVVQVDTDFEIDERDITKLYALENAIYIEDNWRIGSRFSSNLGFRLSHFHIKNSDYVGAEPRLGLAYNIQEDLSVKASYALMNQYLHKLSNSGPGLPTDLWVPSTSIVKPQRSQQIAAGLAKDLPNKQLAITLEGYYKWMDRVLAYREGASFVDILESDLIAGGEENATAYEDKVTPGKSWSYGTELLIQKKEGRMTGWIGYTLSWTYQQFDELNQGEKFFARYDRRHDMSVVCMYKVREEREGKYGIKVSGTWVYGTGNALTMPVARYNSSLPPVGILSGFFSDSYTATEYTKRNAYRMAAYHRLDLGVQFSKKKKQTIRTWEISVYNAYNRMNPFFYYLGENKAGETILKQVTLFPILPSVSYSIKF